MATKYCVGLLILTVLGCTVLLVIVAVVLSLILTDTGQDSTEGNYSFLSYKAYIYIYHFDTSHQRKPQGYISNIPWEQVYIMIYPAAMVTSQ